MKTFDIRYNTCRTLKNKLDAFFTALNINRFTCHYNVLLESTTSYPKLVVVSFVKKKQMSIYKTKLNFCFIIPKSQFFDYFFKSKVWKKFEVTTSILNFHRICLEGIKFII